MNTDLLRQILAEIEAEGDDMPGLRALTQRSRARRQASDATEALADSRIWQILIGIPVLLTGASVWADQLPHTGLLFASGVAFHIYGALLIAFGVGIRLLARRIDPAAPVIETQERMAQIRRIAGIEGWVVGMSWWVLWIPAIVVLIYTLSGFDLFRLASDGSWLIANLAGGVIGTTGLWLIRRWARASGRGQLAEGIDDLLTGQRVRDAARALDAVRRFAAN
ncbi:MAG: hypothetical protein ABL926_07115 [Novosphingobium sp.]|uniref:hypothetical protein n=1 Tax=Novosphingobium sp. TaxID=1874826 RepID=UPI0032B78890